MTIKVLVVDDSSFIRKRIKEILEFSAESEGPSDLEVIGFAANGLEAIQKTVQLKPDVITMDIQMPVMDGITAVKRIMEEHPVPILMFSAMTRVGAQATFDALQAGAIDFLPKQLTEIDADPEVARQVLRRRVKIVASQAKKVAHHACQSYSLKQSLPQSSAGSQKKAFMPRLIVVAASTGGPLAVQQIIKALPKSFTIPLIIIQHMPQNFTHSYAERLDQLSQVRAREAVNGDSLEEPLILVAPGGMQLEIESRGRGKMIRLREKLQHEIFSPCADITLTSVAAHYPGNALAVIMTGMGSDGKEGADKLKRTGAQVWAQDQASCTIYGMPKAIIDAGLADAVFNLEEMSEAFARLS
ncbi:chemotaxis response regulator protein-glutamate methylesterase [Methylicorpusculum oleiharenae]|uniref:protein-glutamate methylesterase/protein-glutamine glutaminase n=1 Tax=Methylicorpusculum oleiharenae TaxID=1338687 RepID=UPI0013582BA3|nr:chemotaxis response regulator protein-glutamate methylesterase [Methylicorpusculum oleiharenae]MCD2450718.1 chemotaxis response regulator protein-glutamate methylesterase [Methylicorpusculum oleiharenae]